MIKKIGVLASGGNSQSMMAAVNGVIKASKLFKIKPYIIYDGYKGLCQNEIEPVTNDIANLINNKGEWIIGSARFPDFSKESVRKKAVKNLEKHGIQALVVIGGDGSYQGALALTKMGVNCIGLPGTIDNDISSTETTLGFDTTLNIITNAIDNIRTTSQWHKRCAVIEVMGRECGDLALYGGIAADADLIITSENKYEIGDIIDYVQKLELQNKRSVVIVTTELLYDVHKLANLIKTKTIYDTRATVVGHIQRGGNPSARDRYLGFMMGCKAMEMLFNNQGGYCLGNKGDDLISYEINHALKMKRPSRLDQIKMFEQLNNWKINKGD